MLDTLREVLGPYLYIQTLHLLAVMAWVWSTSAVHARSTSCRSSRRGGETRWTERSVRARNWAIELRTRCHLRAHRLPDHPGHRRCTFAGGWSSSASAGWC